MTNINDPSRHGEAPVERELCARNCEERCCRHGYIAWLASENKWYCTTHLVLHLQAEIEAVIGRDITERDYFTAHTDDGDEFTHFVMCPLAGEKREITLAQLEAVKTEGASE